MNTLIKKRKIASPNGKQNKVMEAIHYRKNMKQALELLRNEEIANAMKLVPGKWDFADGTYGNFSTQDNELTLKGRLEVVENWNEHDETAKVAYMQGRVDILKELIDTI